VKARVEAREINRVIEQIVEGVLDGAGEQLAGEIDGQQLGLGVDVFVAGHVISGGEPAARCARMTAVTL
jgi:hypothetical protein